MGTMIFAKRKGASWSDGCGARRTRASVSRSARACECVYARIELTNDASTVVDICLHDKRAET